MKRRSFLRHATHGVTIPSILSALGGTSAYGGSLERLLRLTNDTDKVLVLIYLNGGNDGLNTVVPLNDYSALNKVRPHVVMPENSLLSLPGENFAFHPALKNFKSLYLENRLQVIHSVGYPDQNFSHFRSTDIWMSASNSNELVTSGWGGRYLEALHPDYPDAYPTADFSDPLAIELGHGSSLLFQGSEAAMSMVINNPNDFYELVNNEDGEVPDSLAGQKLAYVNLIARQSQIYGDTVRAAAEKITQQRDYPDDNYLANQLKIVSRLIAGGLRTPLYMVSIGGFDTHDAQVTQSNHTIGEHATLLEQLDNAVMAFMQDLEFLGLDDRVVGLTFSEFGRRIVSNASLGTDHGSAAPLFAFGNAVRGSSLGSVPTITGDETYEDNLPMQYDFRQVYRSLLHQWFDADSSTMNHATIREFDELPIIGNGVTTSADRTTLDGLKVFPNPVSTFLQLTFTPDQGHLQIELFNLQGQKVKSLWNGYPNGFRFQESFNLSDLTGGFYVLQILTGNKRQSVKILKQ